MTDDKEYIGPPKAYNFSKIELPSQQAKQSEPKPTDSIESETSVSTSALSETKVSTDKSYSSSDSSDYSSKNAPLNPVYSTQHQTKTLMEQILEHEEEIEEKKKIDLDWNKIEFQAKTLFKEIQRKLSENSSIINYFRIFLSPFKALAIFFGLFFFFSLVYIKINIHPIITTFFKDRGFNQIAFNIEKFSLSEILLSDITDKEYPFTINKIRIRYSVPDLMRRTIPLVTLDTLKINISKDAYQTLDLNQIKVFLERLGLLSKQSFFKIQDIAISNSSLTLENNKFVLPITFTGNIDIQKSKKMTFPFKIDNQRLSGVFQLVIQKKGNKVSWELSMENGRLSLGKKALYPITSKISADLVNNPKIKTEFNVGTGVNKQKLTSTISSNSDNLYDININFDNFFNSNIKKISLDLKNVDIDKNFSYISTSHPIELTIKDLNYPHIKTKEITGKIFGRFNCSSETCQYVYDKTPSTLTFTNPTLEYNEIELPTFKKLSLNFGKSSDKLMQFKNLQLLVNIPLSAIKEDNKSKDAISSLSIEDGLSQIAVNLLQDRWQSNLTLNNVSYNGEDVSFNNLDFKAQFGSNKNGVLFDIPQIEFRNNPIYTQPFSGKVLVTDSTHATAQLSGKDNQISANVVGIFNNTNKESYSLNIKTNPIVFIDEANLSTLFPFLSDKVLNPKGTVKIDGDFNHLSKFEITGPMNTTFKDFSFDFNNIKVSDLSGNILWDSLLPLGTNAGIQKVSIKEVLAILPFKNIEASFFFDKLKKSVNITKLTASLLGQDVRIEPFGTSYPIKNEKIYFKTKTFDMKDIAPYLNLPDLILTGKASATVTFEIIDNVVYFSEATITSVGDGFISYTGPNLQNELLKELLYEDLKITISPTDILFVTSRKNVISNKDVSVRLRLKKPLSHYVR